MRLLLIDFSLDGKDICFRKICIFDYLINRFVI